MSVSDDPFSSRPVNVSKSLIGQYVDYSDFSTRTTLNNYELVLDECPDRKFFVSFHFLATCSQYFAQRMNNFDKDGESALTVDNVSAEDFLTFLRCLVPCPLRFGVSADNVAVVTALASRFGCWDLLKDCEMFIVDKNTKMTNEQVALLIRHLFKCHEKSHPWLFDRVIAIAARQLPTKMFDALSEVDRDVSLLLYRRYVNSNELIEKIEQGSDGAQSSIKPIPYVRVKREREDSPALPVASPALPMAEETPSSRRAPPRRNEEMTSTREDLRSAPGSSSSSSNIVLIDLADDEVAAPANDPIRPPHPRLPPTTPLTVVDFPPNPTTASSSRLSDSATERPASMPRRAPLTSSERVLNTTFTGLRTSSETTTVITKGKEAAPAIATAASVPVVAAEPERATSPPQYKPQLADIAALLLDVPACSDDVPPASSPFPTTSQQQPSDETTPADPTISINRFIPNIRAKQEVRSPTPDEVNEEHDREEPAGSLPAQPVVATPSSVENEVPAQLSPMVQQNQKPQVVVRDRHLEQIISTMIPPVPVKRVKREPVNQEENGHGEGDDDADTNEEEVVREPAVGVAQAEQPSAAGAPGEGQEDVGGDEGVAPHLAYLFGANAKQEPLLRSEMDPPDIPEDIDPRVGGLVSSSGSGVRKRTAIQCERWYPTRPSTSRNNCQTPRGVESVEEMRRKINTCIRANGYMIFRYLYYADKIPTLPQTGDPAIEVWKSLEKSGQEVYSKMAKQHNYNQKMNLATEF